MLRTVTRGLLLLTLASCGDDAAPDAAVADAAFADATAGADAAPDAALAGNTPENRYAATYHVDHSGGLDSNDGLTPATAWQTLARVGAAALVPDDVVALKRGEVWGETLVVPASGTAGHPIVISTYGSGANPVLDGFLAVTAWSDAGGGVYDAPVTIAAPRTALVTVNGVNTPMGRYPDDGAFLTYESAAGTTSITDTDLAATPSWVGAEIVIRKNAWVLDRNLVTGHAGGTLSYTALGYPFEILTPGYGYFFQNDVKTLDDLGDWSYDGAELHMVFGPAGPGAHLVRISALPTLVSITGQSYVTIDNLHLIGANDVAVRVQEFASGVVIEHCTIELSGNQAINANTYADSLAIVANEIRASNDVAIRVGDASAAVSVTDNVIRDTGTIVGAFSTWGARGIDFSSDGGVVRWNRILNTGYNAIQFYGAGAVVDANLIDTFCTMFDDGGGIYTAGLESGREITNNIVLNGRGNPQGTSDPTSFPAEGIYVNEPIQHVLISGNTVAHCAHDGIKLHEAQYITITGNTGFDNQNQLEFCGSGAQPDYPIGFNSVSANLFVARTTAQSVLSYLTSSGNADEGVHPGTSDGNVFARPLDDPDGASFSLYQEGIDTWPGSPYTLAEWRAISGGDATSTRGPAAVASAADIVFVYNDAKVARSFALPAGVHLDMRGGEHSGEVTLAPFTSMVLVPRP